MHHALRVVIFFALVSVSNSERAEPRKSMFAPFAAHHNTTGIAQLTTFSTTTVLPSKTIPFSATSSAARAIVHVSNGETVAVAAGVIVVGTGIGGFFIFNGITSPIAGGASVVAGSSASAPGDLTNPEDPTDPDDPNYPVSTNEPDKIKSDAFDTTTGASPQTSVKPSSPVSTSTSDDTKSDVSGMATSTTPQTSATASFPISTGKSDGTKSDTLATTSTTLRTSVTASSARPTSTSTDDVALSWIDHDKVAALTQNASPGLEGQLELRFNPDLYVSGGCDPYPAVDALGSLGAGLKPTGGGRSGCGDGKGGQVYVRRGVSQGHVGIMYSYYFPKVRWAKGDNNGYRHYWASIVVWLNRWGCRADDITSTWAVGVSFTTDHLTWGDAKGISFRSSEVGVDMPTHPQMQIHDIAIAPFTGASGDKVYSRVLVGWESLPEEALQALSNVKYEKTEVPFIEANFQRQLDAAYRESFYHGLSDTQGC
ncbi:hypothetical protein CGCSCA5_v010429 [Colletotrichum siamense]|nr:hypothetical protein CGCSCA5_v010429 [Colletotrichum siamense]KAF4879725.1 hypothetical protein CGCSCA1_v001224 [Colletotrichum siamense]